MTKKIQSQYIVSESSSDDLLQRNEEVSKHIQRLQERIIQLEGGVDAVRCHSEEACINKSRLLAIAIHDLRQPLQTLDLISDALASRIKDENYLKFIEPLGKAVTAASNTLNRISEIARQDAEHVDTMSHVSQIADVSDRRRSSEHSILLVEEDTDVAATLDFILAAEGYQVSVVADGWQALELSEHGTKWPDLVIADYDLPNGLNGLDMIESLRDRLDHDFATIILTSEIPSSVSHEIERRGHGRLRKPVNAVECANLVQLALAGHQISGTQPRPDADPEKSYTVYVVDDEPSILEAMRDVLEGAGCAVETFTTGSAFFAACPPDRKGCVLVDANMDGMDGFELLERLKAMNYELPAIMITGAGDVPRAVRAMKAGAVDFIEKPVSARELLDRLRNVLTPGPSVAASSRQDAAVARFATLTKRQRQIIGLIMEGEANKNIAYKLGLSQRTVESHRAAIMRKTGAKSFAALVRWAIAAN